MEEIIKEFLYYLSLICGSLTLISLFIIGTIRLICTALDHLRVADTLRKAIKLYIKTNRPDLEIRKANAGVAFNNKEDNQC